MEKHTLKTTRAGADADVEHPTAPYTIRRLGQTAWATVPTLAEALTERDTADRICQRGHLIIDACGELVWLRQQLERE
jgi:hypothetical protein